MRKIFAAIPVAILVASAPSYASVQQHVQAAKKAERKGEWRKALGEWKAAYSQDVNAEYLIGIGDAYSHLGNTTEAKKSYEAYLADPLALPANVETVKAKLASLDAAPGLGLPPPSGGLALPGAEPSLGLPDAAPGLPPPGEEPPSKKGKKGKKNAEPALGLPPPGLDLPGAAPTAKNDSPGLELPGSSPTLALPGPSKKPEEKKVAVLELPGSAPTLGLPGPAKAPEKAPEVKSTVAKNDPPAVHHTGTQGHEAKPVNTNGKQGVSVAVAPTPQEPKRVPDRAIVDYPAPTPVASSGGSKTLAYITAGVALASLGGGAFALSKAGAAHSDLTGSVHSGAAAQGLLEDERRNRTLSFVGFAGGLVAAGLATAMFAF